MSKRSIFLIITGAFVVGVFVTLGCLLIFQKYKITSSNEKNEEEYMATVVLDGFEIPIPNQYAAAVFEDIGLSYCDKDSFEMGISVIDGSYDETLKSMDLLSKDIAEWFELKKAFEEIAVDGHSYIYCVYEDMGETILLAYKKADEEHAFEIMVRCLRIDQMKFQSETELVREYESYILIADSLLGDAKPTKAENTPVGTTYVAGDMYADTEIIFSSDYSSEDVLYNADEKSLIQYQIEDDFYLFTQEIKPNYYSMKAYQDSKREIVTTLIVDDYQRKDVDAKVLMTEGASTWTDSEPEIKNIEINGYIFYYYSYVETYIEMGETFETHYFEAATDLKNGTIYRISAFSEVSSDAELADTYLKFMMIEEP